MRLIVRMPEAEVERLEASADRFRLSNPDADRLDTVYEAEFERDELDAFCRTHGFACTVGDDGMGEVRRADRVVARVRPPGRIV